MQISIFAIMQILEINQNPFCILPDCKQITISEFKIGGEI
jgi:hypothetical protein